MKITIKDEDVDTFIEVLKTADDSIALFIDACMKEINSKMLSPEEFEQWSKISENTMAQRKLVRQLMYDLDADIV